jgi:hypothetical protein
MNVALRYERVEVPIEVAERYPSREEFSMVMGGEFYRWGRVRRVVADPNPMPVFRLRRTA